MAHFAEINNENKVVNVIVIDNNFLLDENNNEVEEKGIDYCEELYGHRNFIQTSYNSNIRGNFAGVGSIYIPKEDFFILPQPYPSWTLDENYIWQPPVDFPEDMNEPGNVYLWNEEELNWIKLNTVFDEDLNDYIINDSRV
jgi:hypothetical protein